MSGPKGQERAKAFGIELKLARVRASLTQTELAEAIGVHATSVSQWERGDRADVPGRDIVVALDEVLGSDGALTRASGWSAAEDNVVRGGFTGNSPIAIPLPGNLTAGDVQLLLSLAQQLSEAHRGDNVPSGTTVNS